MEHVSHHTKPHNIHTTIRKTHQRTYQGQQRSGTSHRIICRFSNLKNIENSTAQVMNQYETRLVKGRSHLRSK